MPAIETNPAVRVMRTLDLARAHVAEHGGTVVWWETITSLNPPYRPTAGIGVRTTNPVAPAIPVWWLWPSPLVTGARKSLYLIEDGADITPCFVYGSEPGVKDWRGYVIAQAIPTAEGVNASLSGAYGPVDLRRTLYGPRRAYHLRVSDTLPEWTREPA